VAAGEDWLDGRNLGAQMLKLEEAGYVAMEKRFAGRKPQTNYRLTAAGRDALAGLCGGVETVAGRALVRMRGGMQFSIPLGTEVGTELSAGLQPAVFSQLHFPGAVAPG